MILMYGIPKVTLVKLSNPDIAVSIPYARVCQMIRSENQAQKRNSFT